MNTTDQSSRRRTDLSRTLFLSAVLAVVVIAFQHTLHVLTGPRSDVSWLGQLPHMSRDILLAFPLAVLAVHVGNKLAPLLQRHAESPLYRAALTSQLFLVLVLAGVPLHGKIDAALGDGHADVGMGMYTHAIRDALVSQVVALPAVLVAMLVLSGELRRFVKPLEDRHALASVGAAFLMFVSVAFVPSSLQLGAQAGAANAIGDACGVGAIERTYDVAAIDVDITLNKFGDHDPTGKMYVLTNRIADVRAQEASGEVSTGLRNDAIQPLAIRANAGECLVINFTNQMAATDASFQVKGIPYSVTNSGGEVGLNPSTLSAPGGSLTYRFPLPSGPSAEGGYQINSGSDTRQTLAHGLFGRLMVEPEGSTYLDPSVPGQPLESGWEAIIVDPNGPDFREFVIMMHEIGDEQFDVLDVNDNPLPVVEDLTGTYRPGSRAINYRSEPFGNRLELNPNVALQSEKSLGYSSYAFGDPATPIPRSYLGEPTKTRIAHPGSEMFHIYHLHGGGDRWRRNPQTEPDAFTGGLDKTPELNALSTRMDSQSMGPGEGFSLEHECGAGGCQQAAGDFLFHCHIGQHYVAGMWSFWRVYDTVQPDLAEMPPEVTTPAVAQSGNSLDLIGTVVDGQTIVAEVDVDQPNEIALEDFVADQLPPQGVSLDDQDATVWDWIIEYVDGDLSQPLVLGEPDDTETWANYASPTPGQRPEVLFNLSNARYAWPLFKPHLAKRPPFSPNGHSGAPWLGEVGSASRPDGLCPSTAARTLEYPLSAIDIPIEVASGLTDQNGMLYALNEDIDDIRNNTQAAEPIVLRSNVGDCERLLLTSEQEDANHGGFAKVNLHTHFTQFDPQASDGVITGFSYEQSVRPYSTENRSLTAGAGVGDSTITVTHVNRLREGIFIGVGLGEGMCDPGTGAPVADPDNSDRACTEIRKIIDITGTTITLDAPLENQHASGEAVGVEFVELLWYSDVDSGTVFFHDHVAFENWDHGLFGAHIIEPAGSTWHDPQTGAEIRTGAIADIHTPPTASVGVGQQGSFREMMVFVSNNNPAALPLGAPGELPTINLRSAPLDARDPDFPFSSVTNGDPETPILRAYVGDDVVLRGLGVIDREETIRITGHRFAAERFSPDGQVMDSIHVGISEREDLVLSTGAGGDGGFAGDYLIHTGKKRELEGGAWSIMRVHDTAQGDLQQLPDTPTPPSGPGFPFQTVTGLPPAGSTSANQPCPANAPVRDYDVSLIEVTPASPQLDFGGVMYALDSDAADFIAGTKQPEPLVLRVNVGECLEIDFTNTTNDPAGINLGKLLFDPQASHGVAVGFNQDSSVGRDGSRIYRFYADRELGTSMFFNLAQTREITAGAYGAIIVEPEGSIYRDPVTGDEIEAGVTADIIAPTGIGFREQVLLFQDEDDRIGSDIMPYREAVTDFAGINYGNDPFRTAALDGRLDVNADPSKVYDSDVHGDPMLMLNAYVGDPVRLRVGVGSGEASHVFGLDGHRFPWEADMVGSEELAQKGLLPFESFDVELIGGAGGGEDTGADYLMGDVRYPFHEAGMWGILRTHDTPQPDLLPIVPLCNGVPVTVFIANGDTPTTGNDVILGTEGDDVIDGLAGDDIICGVDGHDELIGNDGNDIILGGDGNDTLDGGDDGDQLIGERGNDTLRGGATPDYLNGGEGNDTIDGDGGNDIIEGHAGNDILRGGPDNDVITGHDGQDTLIGDTLGALTGGHDYLWGGDDVDTFDGGPGHDYLDGGEEGETMNGDEGDDIILGHGGDDILNGHAGFDYLWGGTGIDEFNGGDDRDTLDGGAEGETMNGGGGQDDIFGNGGNDILNGDAGSDYLWGGPGLDTFNGGPDADYLEGGLESESMNGGGGDDFVIGHAGNDTLNGDAGSDYLWGGTGLDTFNGGPDADFLDGGFESETMNGDGGNDTIIGAGGGDTLNGGDDIDYLDGGIGNDTLSGDAGDPDTCVGGTGIDTIDPSCEIVL